MTTIGHKNLSGTQLHETKGIGSAADNTVATSISNATTWAKLTAANLTGTGNSFGGQLFHVRDAVASGTAAQTLTGASYVARNLNTTVTNEISGASLSGNTIILPSGTYFILSSAPAVAAAHRLRLYNVSDSAILLQGVAAGSSVRSECQGRFTLSGTKNLEFQHWASTSTAGGTIISLGVSEIYSEVMIWKVG